MSQTRRVTRDYRRAYPDPVEFREGDRLVLGREDDEYPGWIWCTDPHRRGGWAPIDLVDRETGLALSDYNARELSVRAGERVIIDRIAHGWAWAINSEGEAGWVPLAHLEGVEE